MCPFPTKNAAPELLKGQNTCVCGYLRIIVTYYGNTVVGEFNIRKYGTPLNGHDPM